MDNRREIVFIDTSLTDWETLLSSFRHNFEIVLLDPHQNGLEQIATHLSTQIHQSLDSQSITNVSFVKCQEEATCL